MDAEADLGEEDKRRLDKHSMKVDRIPEAQAEMTREFEEETRLEKGHGGVELDAHQALLPSTSDVCA